MSARRKAHFGLFTFAAIMIASMATLVIGNLRQPGMAADSSPMGNPIRAAAVTSSR